MGVVGRDGRRRIVDVLGVDSSFVFFFLSRHFFFRLLEVDNHDCVSISRWSWTWPAPKAPKALKALKDVHHISVFTANKPFIK